MLAKIYTNNSGLFFFVAESLLSGVTGNSDCQNVKFDTTEVTTTQV